MKKKTYIIDNIEVSAKSLRTAKRRVRGYLRGEMDIDGDGSFSMTMIEVITAVQHEQPVKFIVLDNGYLGMVRQWQEMFYNRRYSAVDHPCPDFGAIARGFGAHAITVSDRSELSDAMNETLTHEGPVVLDVKV